MAVRVLPGRNSAAQVRQLRAAQVVKPTRRRLAGVQRRRRRTPPLPRPVRALRDLRGNERAARRSTTAVSTEATIHDRSHFAATQLAEPDIPLPQNCETPALAGASSGGRYWARTSDPQLVESICRGTGQDFDGRYSWMGL